jgi:hypothetical protein
MATESQIQFQDSATRGVFTVVPRSTPPTDPQEDAMYLDDGSNTASGLVGWRIYISSTWTDVSASSGGAGDVSGGGSSTDNAVPRWNGAGGDTIQDSGVTIDGSDNMDIPGALTLGTALAVAEGGTGATSESAARTALGLAIGSDVQAWDGV